MAITKTVTIELVYRNHDLQYDEDFQETFEFLKDNDPSLVKEIVKSVDVEDAYIVISQLSGNKDRINYTLSIYTDNSKKHLITTRHYIFVPDVSTDTTPNYHVQAYNHAKANEYVGAIDC